MSDREQERPGSAPSLPFSDVDSGRSRAIRRTLERLREHPDPELRRLADDVLAGRTAFRDIPRSPVFDRLATERVEVFRRQWDALGPDQQQALVRQGRERVEALRAQAAREAAEVGRAAPATSSTGVPPAAEADDAAFWARLGLRPPPDE